MVDRGRSELIRVFRYLESLNNQRNPPQREISRYPYKLFLDSIPAHSLVSLNGEDYILKVRRVKLTPCPPPPESILGWLEQGWDGPSVVPKVFEKKLYSQSPNGNEEAFDEEPRRVIEYESWLETRNTWIPGRRVEEIILRLYQDLYEQHSLIERDGERFELLLGDGFVQWQSPEGPVNHPVLLQPVELEFSPEKTEFRIVETARPVEFYSAPLRSTDVMAQALARTRAQITNTPELHPLEDEMTTPFLRGLASSLDEMGEYLTSPPKERTDNLIVFRSLVVFRRNKTAGLDQAIRQVLDDLAEDPSGEVEPSWLTNPPEGLMKFVGIDTRPTEEGATDDDIKSPPEDDEETYFTKPANHEQYQIVRKLRAAGCVLVQGPPGTGKTHTIANLLGHLLAEGKSVLVTSHTTKALSVVVEKVVAPLQPLCVSVLESDRENREKVESSVRAMSEKLGAGRTYYSNQVSHLRDTRTQLMAKVRELRSKLRATHSSEYKAIIFRQESLSPIQAAKETFRNQQVHGWIPGKIASQDELPLTNEDFIVLYSTNSEVSIGDESNFPDSVPDLGQLTSPESFDAMLTSASGLRSLDLTVPSSIVTRPIPNGNESIIDRAISLCQDATGFFSAGNDWKRQVVDLAHRGESDQWKRLVDEVASVNLRVQSVDEQILRAGPKWVVEINRKEAISRCLEIEQHLQSGRKLNQATMMLRPAWNKIVKAFNVADGMPATQEHFTSARLLIEVTQARDEFVRIWNGRMSDVHGPQISVDSEKPERVATPFSEDIRSCLHWQASVLQQLQDAVQLTGLSIPAAQLDIAATTKPTAFIDRLLQAINEIILPSLFKLKQSAQLLKFESALNAQKDSTRILSLDYPAIPLLQELDQNCQEEDAPSYRLTYNRLVQIYGKGPVILARRDLLSRLSQAAPEWAQAIRVRKESFGGHEPNGDLDAAWRWKRIDQELSERSKTSIQDLVSDLSTTRRNVEKVTESLVECLSWEALTRKTSMAMKMSLTGYVQVLKRIGKGTGKRVPKLILEAQKLMSDCQTAVPVWVMPLSRLVESFNIGSTNFDVVIIDEASQLDLMGLLAMYMAKQVIIVGDDKQVEPLAVGANIEDTQALIDEHLKGIPRSQLWDGKQSVYSLAEGAFEPIRLREHFRCVPDIIRFSNQLSYEGSILPLRESAGVSTLPFVVPLYVENAFTEGGINKKEAERLVAHMKACLDQPEYEGKTFGIIHLVGDDNSSQSKYVRALASQSIGDIELQSRKFRCGNSAQFQGDERDIMFLSVVDVPEEGPLTMKAEDLFKKRYNVAASRARDQMWVVYSLEPETDLKQDDLRRQIITYALDPTATSRLLAEKEPLTESDFETRVLRRLMDSGFVSIEPQYWVGAYRLDFAIRQGKLRVAIECDGEEFHGPEKLDEDLARQATLERLGWQFIRVRGSEFYRNEDEAINRIVTTLEDVGITRGPNQSEPQGPNSTDLLTRVKLRAAELLAPDESLDDQDLVVPVPIGKLAQHSDFSSDQKLDRNQLSLNIFGIDFD